MADSKVWYESILKNGLRRSFGANEITESNPLDWERLRILKDGEVIVVDFKFGKPYPEYNIQVKEYMDLLHGMGYEQVSGYLWYVFYNQLEKIE